MPLQQIAALMQVVPRREIAERMQRAALNLDFGVDDPLSDLVVRTTHGYSGR
jgi:hypothetical protein